MQSSLYEQLAAARAELQAAADAQQKLSKAQATAIGEIRRLEGLKTAAEEAAEAAAQVGARRLLGEASDKEADAASKAADDAARAATGVDRVIAQLQRENELINERYMATVPASTAAQNSCNVIRAAIVRASAEEAAAEYLTAANAMRDALVRLLAHNTALERVKEKTGFYPHILPSVEVPAFPTLDAFKPNQQWRLVLPVADAAKLKLAADAVLRDLGTDGKAL